jgi:hypothetical protein
MATRLLGVGILLFGALYLALAAQLPMHTLAGPGAGFFPVAVGVLLIASGAVAVFARGVLHLEPTSRLGLAKVVATLAGLFAFCALLPVLGYLASAVLLCVAALRLFGTSWRASLAIGGALAVVTWAIFVPLLGLTLPAGSLFS